MTLNNPLVPFQESVRFSVAEKYWSMVSLTFRLLEFITKGEGVAFVDSCPSEDKSMSGPVEGGGNARPLRSYLLIIYSKVDPTS